MYLAHLTMRGSDNEGRNFMSLLVGYSIFSSDIVQAVLKLRANIKIIE